MPVEIAPDALIGSVAVLDVVVGIAAADSVACALEKLIAEALGL